VYYVGLDILVESKYLPLVPLTNGMNPNSYVFRFNEAE